MPRLYKNCTNFNKRYLHGVGRLAPETKSSPATSRSRTSGGATRSSAERCPGTRGSTATRIGSPARSTKARHNPARPMSGKSVHFWWYRMCELAGLVAKGQRSGLNLHRGRHGFALEVRPPAVLQRVPPSGHWADDELAIAFEALAAAREGR